MDNQDQTVSEVEFKTQVEEFIKPLIRTKLRSFKFNDDEINVQYPIHLNVVLKTHGAMVGDLSAMFSIPEERMSWCRRYHKKALEILFQVHRYRENGKSNSEILQILASTPIYH